MRGAFYEYITSISISWTKSKDIARMIYDCNVTYWIINIKFVVGIYIILVANEPSTGKKRLCSFKGDILLVWDMHRYPWNGVRMICDTLHYSNI